MNSSTQRTNTQSGRPQGLALLALGQKAINLAIHDTGQPGIGYGTLSGNGAEIYGCILWGNGIYDINDPGSPTNPWTRGSGIYGQNNTGSRYVTDVISFKNFTTGMKAYTLDGYANGFKFVGNIAFWNGVDGIEFDSAHHPAQGITLISNCVYYSGTSHMGIYGTNQNDIAILNNYFVSDDVPAISVRNWANIVMSNNVFTTVALTNPYSGPSCIAEAYVTNNVVQALVDNNSYYGGGVYIDWGLLAFLVNGSRWGWSDWKSKTLWDAHSAYIPTNCPTQNVTILRTNKYERGRAHLVVFNWESNSTINVDISNVGLAQGQSFEVRDVQNYLGTPVIMTNFDAAHPTISIPLTLTNVTPLIGDVVHLRYGPNTHTKPVQCFCGYRESSACHVADHPDRYGDVAEWHVSIRLHQHVGRDQHE